jgi:CYTH domain-containing protein
VVNVHTTRKRISPTEEIVTERQMNNNLYEMMLALADPNRLSIHKLRKSFIWKGQYFELDFYQDQLDGLVILETKGITEHKSVKFPPFIRVKEDLTCSTEYYNYNLAKKR